jgi:hypothetical protein
MSWTESEKQVVKRALFGADHPEVTVSRATVLSDRAWHPELESHREADDLACSPAWKTAFPALRWWNADGRLGGTGWR